MVTFEESKMVFSFPEDDVYRIEKSSLLADVELNFKLIFEIYYQEPSIG